MQKFVLLVIEIQCYLMQYEWTCLICNYNIIKQKHELTLNNEKN